MTTESPEFRVSAIKTRRLEIAATLAKWKHEFLVYGLARSRGERATLEAEDAQLALEQHLLFEDAKAARVARKVLENASLLAVLIDELESNHLGDFVEKAHARAAIAAHEAKQAQAEPVAVYQYQRADGSWIDQTKDSHDYNVRHGQAVVRVLYTRPAPKREPLTDEQAREAVSILQRMEDNGEPVNCVEDAVKIFARVIDGVREAANGIKEAP